MTLSASLLSAPAAAVQRPIGIDGTFDDWRGANPAATDPAGDAGPSGLDVLRLWIADDEAFLFLRIELAAPFDLSENNDLRLYIDADGNPATGLAIGDMGADLQWRLGQRTGTLYAAGGGTSSVEHADIRFRAAPTIDSATFEMALGRDELDFGPLVRVLLRDQNGDQIPDNGSAASYAMDVGAAPPAEILPLSRLAPDDLRLVTWNVENDGPWSGTNEPRFGRLMAAADADIFCFQEINGHSVGETVELVESWVAPLPGDGWHGAGHADVRIVSRYPVAGQWPLDGNLAALIETTAAIGTPMLIINAHLPCCTNDAGRQAEVDRIMGFIREARTPGGTLELAAQTPIVICGDMNLVGLAQQLETLLTGDIVDEGTFGPDVAPDWDGSALRAVDARQTELRMDYTWRSDTSTFWPGRLDYMIFTDHVLDAPHAFLAYTPLMSASALAGAGLQSGDSLASDHLLFAVDLRPVPTGPQPDVNGDGTVNVDDLVAVITAWGPCPGCPADVNDDGVVNVDDLVAVIVAWG